MKKGVWFGLSIMAGVVALTVIMLPPLSQITQGHLGLLMLSLIVVAIMLGFPTAFTLMGMGIIFAFAAYSMQGSPTALRQTLDLFVQRAYSVMTNDVLISIPLFVFMGYLVERANLIEKLFEVCTWRSRAYRGRSPLRRLSPARYSRPLPASSARWSRSWGCWRFPAMLRAGYNVKLSAGVITAGGCLGILIPPSVMLIVYGATAGVSVVQLYAGAFLPGIMLALLYIGYVVVIAKLRPNLAPPLTEKERYVPLATYAQGVANSRDELALFGLWRGVRTVSDGGIRSKLRTDLLITVLPAIAFVVLIGLTWNAITKPNVIRIFPGLEQMGGSSTGPGTDYGGGLQEPPSGGLQEPPGSGLQEPPTNGLQEPPKEPDANLIPKVLPKSDEATLVEKASEAAKTKAAPEWHRDPTPTAFWITLGIGAAILLALYASLTWARLEVFKMLLASFFPLAVLILAVLGTIVFGLATPTEAAAVGSLGGFVLAAVYLWYALPTERRAVVLRTWVPLWLVFAVSVIWFLLLQFEVVTSGPPGWVGLVSMLAFAAWCVVACLQVRLWPTVKESVFLTAKTSAMVCWLFVGSSIFSAAFALLGGQELVERWVLSLGLSPIQFLILAQIIIFLLGWPLEWTEIIVIFMPIFIPLLAKFNIDPLFFGLLVALNLQTAFLSPPVAMAAFYLKGVAPRHVTLNQIFAGMMPFMAIQVVALALLYLFPAIGLWLPSVLYK
jgi:TRAP-type mannitol/chloroaromatic compound transport system permease large subunit